MTIDRKRRPTALPMYISNRRQVIVRPRAESRSPQRGPNESFFSAMNDRNMLRKHYSHHFLYSLIMIVYHIILGYYIYCEQVGTNVVLNILFCFSDTQKKS